MAVTKQVYTLSPTWTASVLASLFRSAFIDAGLMTEWYDDFLSGSVENRILEVVNDGTKTYGTVYYWFMFTTTEVRVHTALAWDATTHVPTGTVYQDYFSTTTNSTTNHASLYTSLVATTSLTLTRYTSAINTSCTWFYLRQATSLRFLIPFGAYTATSFVDQNITAFNGLITSSALAVSLGASFRFLHAGAHTRRTYLGATSQRGATFSGYYYELVELSIYSAIGNSNNNGNGNLGSNVFNIRLPTAHTNTHTGLANDYTPVFTSILCSPYLPVLPADFAMCAYYASNAVTVQDTFIVSAGVEEYEVLNTSIGSTGGILFLARTVG
tara:strand:- start:83 stop:1063 length:981 start_codon:yes stop_codon:yes gene_type:complete